MPMRPAERRLRLVGDQERPREASDPVAALTASAAFLDQQAAEVEDAAVADLLQSLAANARLEAFIRHTPGVA